MGKSKAYKGFASAEDFFKELWGTSDIPEAHAMTKTDKEGEYAVFCPDGKNHKMKVTQGEDGPVFTLSEEEAQRPKRSFWDRIKSFFGFGETKQQFEERRDRFDALGGGSEQRNDYVKQYDKKLDFDTPTVVKGAEPEPVAQNIIDDGEAQLDDLYAAAGRKKQAVNQQQQPQAQQQQPQVQQQQPQAQQQQPQPEVSCFTEKQLKSQLDDMMASKNPVLVSIAKEVKEARTVISAYAGSGLNSEGAKAEVANAMQKVAAFHLLSSSEQAKQEFADKVESMNKDWDRAFTHWSKEKFTNSSVTNKLSGKSLREDYLEHFNATNGANMLSEMQEKNYPDLNFDQPTDLSIVQMKQEEMVQVDGREVKAKDAWERAWRNSENPAEREVYNSYKKADQDLLMQKMYADAGVTNPNHVMFKQYKQDEAVAHMQKIMAFRLINSAPDSKKVFDNMMQANTDPNRDILGEFANKFVPKDAIKNAFPKNASRHGDFIDNCLETCGKNVARRIVNSATKTNNNPVKEAVGPQVGNN